MIDRARAKYALSTSACSAASCVNSLRSRVNARVCPANAADTPTIRSTSAPARTNRSDRLIFLTPSSDYDYYRLSGAHREQYLTGMRVQIGTRRITGTATQAHRTDRMFILASTTVPSLPARDRRTRVARAIVAVLAA